MSPSDITPHECPACGSVSIPALGPKLNFDGPVFRAYFHDFYPPSVAELIKRTKLTPGQLHACAECDTIFHGIIPADQTLNTFYATLQSATYAKDPSVDPHRQEQRLLELMMVARFLSPRTRRPAVLDFGTGDGSWALLAAAAGCETTATDTADDAFARLAAAGVTCLAPHSLPADRYDFINSEQVFEHLPAPYPVLTKLAASLRPGGVLKIGVPHDPDLASKLRAPDWTARKDSRDSLNSLAPLEHLNAFSPSGLKKLGERCGLIPLSISGWSLIDPRTAPRPGLKTRLIRRLRDRLGQCHRPPYRLAQTRFFLRAA